MVLAKLFKQFRSVILSLAMSASPVKGVWFHLTRHRIVCKTHEISTSSKFVIAVALVAPLRSSGSRRTIATFSVQHSATLGKVCPSYVRFEMSRGRVHN